MRTTSAGIASPSIVGRARRRRARAGFTLVEMLVVVAIVVIIIALAAPAFNDMIARQRVRGINAELVTDLHFARTEALHRNKKIVMSFGSNTSVTCYTIFTSEPAGLCHCLRPENSRCLGQSRELKTVVVARSTTVTLAASSATLSEFEFDPQRSDVAQDNAQVDVVSSRNGQLRTRINKIGRTSVCSPDGSITGVPHPC